MSCGDGREGPGSALPANASPGPLNPFDHWRERGKTPQAYPNLSHIDDLRASKIIIAFCALSRDGDYWPKEICGDFEKFVQTA